MSRSSSSTAPRRTHGIMARLMRLAAGVLVVTLVLAALVAHSHTDANAGLQKPHRCIHDEVLRRQRAQTARAAAPSQVLSSVGLPLVSAVKHDAEPALAAVETLSGGSDEDQNVPETAPVQRAASWNKLRVLVSAADLNTTGYHCSTVGESVNNKLGENVICAADDIMTEEKYDILMNYLIPQAMTLHEDRLQVHPVQSTWAVTNMKNSLCGNFKIPTAHMTTGVSNTDFVLYVTSVPSESGVLAWATTCQVFQNTQPAVGVINIPAVNIVSRYDQAVTRTVTHEIAHALGFSSAFFGASGISATVTGIRGKPYAAPVITSSTVVEKTREQYGCSSATYMEVEDMGGPGSAGSHWKMRNAQDELMAPASSAGYYTALTMALFQDLGYYKANFRNAEKMPWGSNTGCAFLDEKCMTNNVTKYPEMFCDVVERGMRCPTNRLYVGTCVVDKYSANLPDYFQYFTVPSVGGFSAFLDYCPYVVPWGIGACNQNPATANVRVQNFNVFSDAARCIDGDFKPKIANVNVTSYHGLCANVRCNAQAQTYSIQVYGAGSTYLPCKPGTTFPLDRLSDAFERGGYITCPNYIDVCQSNVQGIMDYENHRNGAAALVTTLLATAVAFLAVLMPAMNL